MTHCDKCHRYADAVLSFADRVVVLDHHEGVAYALTLHDGAVDTRCDARTWLRLATSSLTALAQVDAAPAASKKEDVPSANNGHVLGHALHRKGADRGGTDMASERTVNSSGGVCAHKVGQCMVATATDTKHGNRAAASSGEQCIDAVASAVEHVEVCTAAPSLVVPHLASSVSHQPQMQSEEDQHRFVGTNRSAGALNSAKDVDRSRSMWRVAHVAIAWRTNGAGFVYLTSTTVTE